MACVVEQDVLVSFDNNHLAKVLREPVTGDEDLWVGVFVYLGILAH